MQRYTLKSNLKDIMKAKEITYIRQLSKESGVAFESCRRLYNDEAINISRDVLAQLCVHLDITLDDLLTIVPKKEE